MKAGKTWVRDLKNFLALGTPGGTAGCSPVLMLVKLVAPHLPAEIISWEWIADVPQIFCFLHFSEWQGLSVFLHASNERVCFLMQNRNGLNLIEAVTIAAQHNYCPQSDWTLEFPISQWQKRSFPTTDTFNSNLPILILYYLTLIVM